MEVVRFGDSGHGQLRNSPHGTGDEPFAFGEGVQWRFQACLKSDVMMYKRHKSVILCNSELRRTYRLYYSSLLKGLSSFTVPCCKEALQGHYCSGQLAGLIQEPAGWLDMF